MITTKACRHGTMAYLSNDFYIGRSYDVYGEHSEIEVQFLLSLVKPGDVVVDGGANVGAMTVPLMKKVRDGETGHVIAFEPQPRIFELLKENVRVNDGGAVMHPFALGAEARDVSFQPINYEEGTERNFGGMSLLESVKKGELIPGGIDVKMVTLDSFALERLDLLKADVEGLEADVLRGAKETIARCRPLLYVENQQEDKSPALIELIGSMGYELYWHLPKLFNPDNFAKRVDDVLGIISVNMLCVPREKADKWTGVTQQLRRVAGPHETWTGTSDTVRPPTGWACVVRFGGIGDNLMAASAARALKRKGFKVEVVTSADAAWPIFQHNPNIDKLSIKTKSELPADMLAWQKWFKGRSDEYDVFAHLSHSCEGLLALFPASTQFWWPAHFRRKLCNRNYLEVVNEIAGCGYDFGPLFYASEPEKAHALETKRKVRPDGGKVIAMCLSGTRRDKRHPLLPLIVARIIKETGVPVVAIGSQERDFESAKAMQRYVQESNGSDAGYHVAVSTKADENGHRAINWPIRRTIAFAQGCDLVIGPDTGVMWGVAFEEMPKLVLLGHASPENITKHWINTTTMHADQARVPCWPCHQLHDEDATCTINQDKNAPACISDISVDVVVSTVKEILSR